MKVPPELKAAWVREVGSLIKEGADLDAAVPVAIAALPSDKQRAVIELTLAGYDQAAIGQALGIKQAAVSRLYRRACDFLPGLLQQVMKQQLSNIAKKA